MRQLSSRKTWRGSDLNLSRAIPWAREHERSNTFEMKHYEFTWGHVMFEDF